MADFKTHITTSTVLGIAYGSAGHFLYDVSIPHSLVAGALCSVAGMLPDLDSDSGVPLREMLSFVSVVVPMMMIRRFYQFGWTPETMVFVAGVMYVGIRFGLGSLFRRFTKHRGMWHSVPAALIAGLVTYLVCLSPELGIRVFKSWAVVLGFLSHLLLDEIYSVDLSGRRIRIKSSSGTALKFFGDSKVANVTAYSGLFFLGYLVFKDRWGDNFVDLPIGIDLSQIREQIERTASNSNIFR
ncbi:MAG: metal-dependent hydrolase [Pirellulaceae bacterium]